MIEVLLDSEAQNRQYFGRSGPNMSILGSKLAQRKRVLISVLNVVITSDGAD